MSDEQTIIETERLRLIAPSMDQLDVMCALWSDPETMRYVSSDGRGWTRERVSAWMERQIKSFDESGMSQLTIVNKATREIIGQCGLEPVDFSGPEIELAYQLGKDHWGMGYATEVASACAAYGFDELGIDRYVALTYSENMPSIRVLEKIGFEFLHESDAYYNTKLNVYTLTGRQQESERS